MYQYNTWRTRTFSLPIIGEQHRIDDQELQQELKHCEVQQIHQQIAQRQPSTLSALQLIKGIGPSKSKHYGRALLQLITQHQANNAPNQDNLPTSTGEHS